MTLNTRSKEFARIGLGMWHHGIDHREPCDHGLGWSDQAAYSEMADLVMQYLACPEMKKPESETLFSNRFAGGTKLAVPDWARVHERVSEFAKYVS
jgi:hypothetical protein